MTTFITFIQNQEQLDLLDPSWTPEIILEPQALSRAGLLSMSQVHSLANAATQKGLKISLQWDILNNDPQIQRGLQLLAPLIPLVSGGMRVQDLGAAEALKVHFPHIPLHLIVETGNHNLLGLQAWEQHFGHQLQRFILSNEIPKTSLADYLKQLSTPCEVLGLGKCLLLYTPRSLLKPLTGSSEALQSYAVSSEETSQPFTLEENEHGSFLYHCHDLCLLDVLHELLHMKMAFIRLDLRRLNTFPSINDIQSFANTLNPEFLEALKTQWPVRLIRGFYGSNRTDRPIQRIKNKYLDQNNNPLVGTVVEVVKNTYVVVTLKEEITLGEVLHWATPEGLQIHQKIEMIQGLDQNSVTVATAPGVWILPFHKGIVPGTRIHKN